MDAIAKTAEILATDYPRAALLGHLTAAIDIAVINLHSAIAFSHDADLARRYMTDLLADLENAKQVNQSVTEAISAEINAKYGLSTPAHSKTCYRRHAHTPHGTCPGTAPEYPGERVETVENASAG
jgi:hypothetical protein